MRLLLDTHVWIWSQEQLGKLGTEAKNHLTQPQTQLYVSPISTLEIARLVEGGRIDLACSLGAWISDTIDSLRCTTIEICHRIAAAAYDLPDEFHQDPADRLLVATARIHHFTLLTADERILAYPQVKSLDARR